MKKIFLGLIILAMALGVYFAAAAKTYQVTGTVSALTSDIITVKKGAEIWEISRAADAQVTGKLAVGAKVTIQYRMVAVKVEVK